MAASIDAVHEKWCAYWLEARYEAQYVPKLSNWFNGGDWSQNPPAVEPPESEYPKVLI